MDIMPSSVTHNNTDGLMDLDSADQYHDEENSFIVKFACRLISFLSIKSLGDDQSCRIEVLGMLKSILQHSQKDYSARLFPHFLPVLTKMSSACKGNKPIKSL